MVLQTKHQIREPTEARLYKRVRLQVATLLFSPFVLAVVATFA